MTKSTGKNTNHKQFALTRRYRAGFMEALDKRTQLYTDLKAVYDELIEDLGGELSIQQRILCERFTFICATLQKLEQEMLVSYTQDKPVSKDLLMAWRNANDSLGGIINKLGVDRKAKKSVDLQTYLTKPKLSMSKNKKKRKKA